MDEVNNMSSVETKRKYRVNASGVKKLLGKLGQPILKVSLVLLVLYLGFISFITFTNTPQKVRVTNLTGRSATVSWVTKYPSKGEVVFTEEDNFSFGPFSDLGKEKSYDDRDYAYAQLEQMQDIVDLRSEALDVENVEVKKQGRYYVHHVTVLGLEEDTKYSFRVGNGTMWWDVDSSDQEYYEHEAPTTSEFWFNTLNDPESLLGPNPAYGRVYTMEDNDGFLRENPSTDAMVFSYATRQSNEEVSMILSSLTNLKGGWTIDKANFRDLEGLSTTFEQGEDNLYVYAQFEDLTPRVGINIAYGVEDSPAPGIVANGEDDVRSEEAEEKELVSKLISPVNAGCIGSFCWGDDKEDEVVEQVSEDRETKEEDVKESLDKPSVSFSESSNQNSYTPPNSEPVANSAGADEWWKAYESDSGDSRSLDNVKDEDNDYWNEFVPEPVKDNIVKKIVDNPDLKLTGSTETSVEEFWGGDEGNNDVGFSIDELKGCSGPPVGSRGCETTPNDNGVAEADCYCINKDTGGYLNITQVNGASQCRPSSCANENRRPEDAFINDATGRLCDIDYQIEQSGAFCAGDVVNGCSNKKGEQYVITVEQADLEGNREACGEKRDAIVLNRSDGSVTGVSNIVEGDFECRDGERAIKAGERFYNTASDPYNPQYSVDYCVSEEDFDRIDVTTACKDFNCGAGNIIAFGAPGGETDSGARKLRAISVFVNCGGGTDLVGGCENHASCDNGHFTTTGYGTCREPENDFALKACNRKCNEDELCAIKRPTIDMQLSFIGVDCFKPGHENQIPSRWSHYDVYNPNGEDTSLVSKVYAGDIEPSVDDSFVYFPSDGLYEVFFNGESIGNRLALEQEGEIFYIDRDSSAGYHMPNNVEDIQDDEDVIFNPTSVEVTASKIAENFKVELKEGINIVSFPFVPIDGEEALRASDLMSYTNTSSIRINHITFFEDGKWKPGYHALSTDENTNSGEDFVLTMGKGYLIIAEEDMLGDNALQVPGRALESEVPVAYKPGWNLVGVHGYIQSYSARTLLDSVNTLDGVTVDNVTWWPTSKGRYEGFQMSEDIEYGFDYPIVKDLGYFVRVSDFTPIDTETKSVIWAPGTDAHNTVGSN